MLSCTLSRMLRATEDAVNVEDLDAVLRNLRKVQWRPAKDDDSDRRPVLGTFYSLISPANLLGGLLAAAISAKLIGPVRAPLVLGVLAGAVLVLSRPNDPAEPGPLELAGVSWQVRKPRARFVMEQLITAKYGADPDGTTQDQALRFYLQLRVPAMLEDLRASHRRWALDLRRRKRTKPPMLLRLSRGFWPGW
jgi:hypothetical protein